jgi:hypothetical protein
VSASQKPGATRVAERPCCIKIRLNTELKRSEFNGILQSLKRTLERQERTGELSMVPSQQGIEVQVEPLTEQSEKFLSPVQDVFGPRGNNGRSRSSIVSDAVH